MNFRIVLAWLLAIPMFLLLLLFAHCFLGSLVLLAFHRLDSQRLFFITGSVFYLFCAHLLYFGSYFAHPPLYQTRLRFLRAVFQPAKFVLSLAVIYAASIGYILHHFKII
jgi:hypothetical protein